MASKGKRISNHTILSFSLRIPGLFLLFLAGLSYSDKTVTDTLQKGEILPDGNELVSDSGYGKFRLCFFSPYGNSNQLRYLGISYKKLKERTRRGANHYGDYQTPISTERTDLPVWVANRNTPISGESGMLTIDSTDGNLKIIQNGRNPIAITWVQGVSGNTSATLLETGNLVLRELNSDGSIRRVLWQSFDYPTDTLLPGMKLGVNLQTGHKWFLQSWIADDYPAQGSFTLGMDPNVTNQLMVSRRGEQVYWSSGPWLNGNFNVSNYNDVFTNYIFSYISNGTEKSFSFSVSEDVTAFPLIRINSRGELNDDRASFSTCREDTTYGSFYERCGDEKLPTCRKDTTFRFNLAFGSISGDGFMFKESDNMTDIDCRAKCLNNCSCVAYATRSNKNNPICSIWRRVTEIIRHKSDSDDTWVIYSIDTKETRWLPWLIFVAVGVLVVILFCSLFYLAWRTSKAKETKRWPWLIVVLVEALLIGIFLSITLLPQLLLPEGGSWAWPFLIIVVVTLVAPLLCYLCCSIVRRRREKAAKRRNRNMLLRELANIESTSSKVSRVMICLTLPLKLFYNSKRSQPNTMNDQENIQENDQNTSRELKIFDFHTIDSATNNFSSANKLGEGGFGPVYKGILLDGQKIAIKRLSRSSGQGRVEFKNEAKLIAKLQHNNLVRILGCSLHGQERILVYEYMPNKSLDFFIFDSGRKKLLNWNKRFNIIEGITQGLIYLHKYSRLKVIHRDLKASNILLDDQMIPKISDFGMARIFGMNESEANTNRVVGTYGYMSPEYAMNGVVSVKTDVFSFGVLVLEIVSGRKNNSFYNAESPLNLVGHAWKLMNEGKSMELMDPTLELENSSCSPNEILRCIHVGLLCVQEQAIDRPTISDVVCMLGNESMLPPPKKPAFFIDVASQEAKVLPENCSANQVTISVMEAR